MVYNILKAPSTATLVSSEVLERDKYGRAVVLMTVDAENSFGAYIRENYCVVIQGIKYDGTIYHNNTNYVQTYTETTKDMVIESLKQINGFGKERSYESYLNSSDFSKSTYNGYNKYYNDELSYFVDSETNTVFAGEYSFKPGYKIEIIKKLGNTTINSINAKNYISIEEYFDFSSDEIKTSYQYKDGALIYVSDDCIGVITISRDVYKDIETRLASADYLNAESICALLKK